MGRSDQDGGIAVADLPVIDEPIVLEAQDLEIRQPFIEILDRTAGYRRDGERMTLLDGGGRPLANFRRMQP